MDVVFPGREVYCRATGSWLLGDIMESGARACGHNGGNRWQSQPRLGCGRVPPLSFDLGEQEIIKHAYAMQGERIKTIRFKIGSL